MTNEGGVILKTENLDEIIRKYSESLIEMGHTYGGEVVSEEVRNAAETLVEETLEEEATNLDENEKPLNDTIMKEESAEKDEDEEGESIDSEPAVRPPKVSFPEGEATASAQFFARVFTGEQAYPVKGAKVVVYRGDNIYAFLETDRDGSTKQIKLPAFEESNSLEPENENQSLEYLADIFAPGFTSQKGLLVSAVGGSEIVLNVLLVPEKEGLS